MQPRLPAKMMYLHCLHKTLLIYFTLSSHRDKSEFKKRLKLIKNVLLTAVNENCIQIAVLTLKISSQLVTDHQIGKLSFWHLWLTCSAFPIHSGPFGWCTKPSPKRLLLTRKGLHPVCLILVHELSLVKSWNKTYLTGFGKWSAMPGFKWDVNSRWKSCLTLPSTLTSASLATFSLKKYVVPRFVELAWNWCRQLYIAGSLEPCVSFSDVEDHFVRLDLTPRAVPNFLTSWAWAGSSGWKFSNIKNNKKFPQSKAIGLNTHAHARTHTHKKKIRTSEKEVW